MDTNSSVVKAWVGVGVGVGAGAGRRAAKWGEMGDISSTVNNKKKNQFCSSLNYCIISGLHNSTFFVF